MFRFPDLQWVLMAVIPLQDVASSTPELITTAVNVLAGGISAVVGGFAGAYLSERFARKRRELDQQVAHKLSAFTLHLQLTAVYSDLMQYREQLGRSRIASRVPEAGRMFRAQYHQAYAGEQSAVHFRAEDLKALASFASNDLLNLIADLDRRFNGVVAALNQYRTDWLAVASTMEGDLHGETLYMALTLQQIRALQPKLGALSKILSDLDPIVEELNIDAYDALVGLYHFQVKALGQREPFEAIDPQGQVVKMMPNPNVVWVRPKQLS